MTPDPKLVEALAELVAAWSQKCPIDHVETTVANDIRHDCQKFFDRHNLVQLPEEPWGWEWEASDGIGATRGRVPTQGAAVVKARNAGFGTGRIRPIYIIPGDPQEVDEKEYRARVYGEFPPDDSQEPKP